MTNANVQKNSDFATMGFVNSIFISLNVIMGHHIAILPYARTDHKIEH